MRGKEQHSDLIQQFVSSFEKLDEMKAYKETNPIAWELCTGEPDDLGRVAWRPLKSTTDPACLRAIYEKIPARFPPLFEALVLSFRWAEVDLDVVRLLPNPPATDLNGLLREMSRDPALWKALIPAGYVQFGRGPDMDYDPVCFDIRSRTKRKDYRVVKIDHEEILCNNRVKVVAELAPSFEKLAQRIIDLADQEK